MILTLTKFIPLFLIIALGYLLKRRGILSDVVLGGIKQIIVNAALPAVLFVSFLTMEIRVSDIWYFITTFAFCVLLLIGGMIFHKTRIIHFPAAPFFFSGFEFGMVGVALFTSIFGIEHLPAILLFGLGHEIFIWFVYAPLLKRDGKSTGSNGLLHDLIRSPIILAIVSALFLNLTGIYSRIAGFWPIEGVVLTASSLASVVTPLILLTIGGSIEFGDLRISLAVRFIALRLLLTAVLGAGLIAVITAFAGPMDSIGLAAAVTFLLLPPPFIIPVFMPEEKQQEITQYSGMLMLYTLISLPLFLLAILII